MGDPRHLLGTAAEAAVATWLQAAGWRLVARRARSAVGGEVDIVAVDPQGTLVAVEVRARHSTRTGAAAWTVDGRRVSRLRRTLAAVGATTSMPHRGFRVDLVAAEPMGDAPNSWRLRRIPGIDLE